jgi:co-chaperonin GroES (HSP10)
MDVFPRKPLLDRVIVREIPIADYYEQPEGFAMDLDNAHIKERSDRGVVVAVGDCVPLGNVTLPMPVVVGDIVFFDEFALTDPVYLNPGHRLRHDLPKYFAMRVADLKGIDVANRNRMVEEHQAQQEMEKAQAGMAIVGGGATANRAN